MANGNNNQPVDVQQSFFNGLQKAQTRIKLFMKNRVQLNGVVLAFDQYSLHLGKDSKDRRGCLVFKSGIATIQPQQRFQKVPMDRPSNRNFQSHLLNTWRKEKVRVKVFLECGGFVEGVIGSFDNFTISIRHNGSETLVFKHAGCSVVPQ